MTPPGQATGNFGYSDSGCLETVKRDRPGGGTSTWSVDYDLAMGASGLPVMSATAVQTWGEEMPPTHAFAMYAPISGASD